MPLGIKTHCSDAAVTLRWGRGGAEETPQWRHEDAAVTPRRRRGDAPETPRRHRGDAAETPQWRHWDAAETPRMEVTLRTQCPPGLYPLKSSTVIVGEGVLIARHHTQLTVEHHPPEPFLFNRLVSSNL